MYLFLFVSGVIRTKYTLVRDFVLINEKSMFEGNDFEKMVFLIEPNLCIYNYFKKYAF